MSQFDYLKVIYFRISQDSNASQQSQCFGVVQYRRSCTLAGLPYSVHCLDTQRGGRERQSNTGWRVVLDLISADTYSWDKCYMQIIRQFRNIFVNSFCILYSLNILYAFYILCTFYFKIYFYFIFSNEQIFMLVC